MNNHKRAFGHDGKHDNLIIAAAADKNSYCNKNGTHDDCESVVAILCNIDYCTKIETKVSPKNLLVESSKNNFIF